MNKFKDIRKQLNLSQTDLSILLQTTRTQLSMFELGQRDLPLKSKILLADLLQFLNLEPENPENLTDFQKNQNLEVKTRLEKELQNNKYQQLLIDRKLKTAKKKYHDINTSLRLANFLEKNNDINDSLKNGMFQIIRNGAMSSLKITNQALLNQYQIKKEVLQVEEEILLKYLKKLS